MAWKANYSQQYITITNEGQPFANYTLLPEPHCEKCSAPVSTASCTYCNDLYGFNRIYALGCYYKGSYADLPSHILRLKNDRAYVYPLSTALECLMRNKYPELLKADAFVPVPAHDDKFINKYYNHADLLAIELRNKTGKAVLDCLDQIKFYSQHESTRNQRFLNVNGAFIFKERHGPYVKNRHLILIDDIVTSGATASECSQILMNNGAKVVDVLVLGRTCQI